MSKASSAALKTEDEGVQFAPIVDIAADATDDAVRSTREVITPELAAELLALKRPGAQVNPTAVKTYSEAMREGRWIYNGQPIIISRKGRLLDGVQRLRACMDTGIAIVSRVTRNIPDDVLHTIDQQRRRSFAGVLEARGVRNALAVQSALIKLIRYDDKTLTRGGSAVPWARMDRVLRANPEIENAVQWSLGSGCKALNEAVRTPLVFMGFRANRAATEHFLAAIQTPDDFDGRDPGVKIRDAIELTRDNPKARLSPVALFAMCVKALNLTMADEKVRSVIRWPDRSAKESEDTFPKLKGYRGLRNPTPLAKALPTSVDLGREVNKLAPGGEDSLTIETIDAAKARQYLEVNRGNRAIVPAHVDAIARDIVNGRWMMNAQPICFSKEGRLLNGQHRLSGVIRAQEMMDERGEEGTATIEVPIERGLADEAFSTYDLQAKKGPLVGEAFESFGDRPLVAAMAVLFWKNELRPTGVRNQKPTSSEVMEILDQHPRLRDLRTFARKMQEFGRSSVLGYAAYRIERDKPELASAFLERFETGAELPSGHIILQLRKKLLTLKKAKASQQDQLAEIMDAWETFKKSPSL